jgi:hypothetical protein
VISLALALGCLTPIVAIAALLLHALIWLRVGIDGDASAIMFSLDAIALALLGPGAHSIDSYRSGRRLVVQPPT